MDVKQSFQNMIGWAKKNPLLAGGIVLVIVLIAWWVSRQGGGSSGAIASKEEEAIPDFSALPLSSDTGGSLLDAFSDPVAGITQPAPVYDAPVFDALPSIPDMYDAGMFDPGSVQDAVAYAPSTVSYAGQAMKNTGTKDIISGYSVGGGLASSVAKKSSGLKVSGVKTGTTGARTPTTAPKRASGSQTPTQALGKGKNYTGVINGVYYVNGYPVTSPSIVTSRPGTGAVKGAVKKR